MVQALKQIRVEELKGLCTLVEKFDCKVGCELSIGIHDMRFSLSCIFAFNFWRKYVASCLLSEENPIPGDCPDGVRPNYLQGDQEPLFLLGEHVAI